MIMYNSKISIKDFEEASGHAKNLISSKVYLTFASDMQILKEEDEDEEEEKKFFFSLLLKKENVLSYMVEIILHS